MGDARERIPKRASAFAGRGIAPRSHRGGESLQFLTIQDFPSHLPKKGS